MEHLVKILTKKTGPSWARGGLELIYFTLILVIGDLLEP